MKTGIYEKHLLSASIENLFSCYYIPIQNSYTQEKQAYFILK